MPQSLGSNAREQPIPVSLGNQPRQPLVAPSVDLGTGRFVGADPATQGQSRTPAITPGGPVTLDFVNVDVRDVLRSVLGDTLGVSYVLDPAVQGTITLQTGQPIPRSAVLTTLQNTLQLNGMALVARDGVYQVLPIANAAREARLGGSGGGFVTRTVTPQYVAAADLQRVLEPMLPPGSSVRAEPSRNLLIITGSDQNVADVQRAIAVFDVDTLRGMSFALLPLRNAQARDVARDVTGLLGSSGSAISSLVRVTPIERLNAILVAAQQPRYIERVQSWVARFDRGTSSVDRQLFVYRVQNGRAADLAGVLQKTLGIAASSAGSGASASPSSGGGSPDYSAGSPGGVGGGSGLGANTPATSANGIPNPLLGGLPSPVGLPPQPGQTLGDSGASPGTSAPPTSSADTSGVRITADEANNALVIRATLQEYRQIEAALQRLDLLPLQVAIEEVTLNDQLSFGLEYFIHSGNFSALLSQTAATGTVNQAFPGFSFGSGFGAALSAVGGSSVILRALQQITNVRVLSSPNLLVLNNQSARLQVGDQVPIATASAVGTLTAGAPIVNSIEYRDTGVILRITPRVNASGLVLLDVAQEVSQVSTTTTSNLDSPTISQRRVTSSVAVADGQTIALGGLISDSRSQSKNGIPVLQDIPYVGFLFGTRSYQNTRTELIVLITPRVIRGQSEAQAVTDELQRKLPMTIPVVARAQ